MPSCQYCPYVGDEFYSSNQSKCKRCVIAYNRRQHDKRMLSTRAVGVDCPVCGKKVRQLSGSHVKAHGYSTWGEFIKEFPDAASSCTVRRDNSRTVCERQWRDGAHDNNAEAARKFCLTKLHVDPVLVQKVREGKSRYWRSVEGQCRKHELSVSMSARVNSPKGRGMVEKAWRTKMRISMANTGSTPWSYNGTAMRSRQEVLCAFILDILRVKWTYEPTRFIDAELRSSYAPDFILRGSGAYLEVKAGKGQSVRKCTQFARKHGFKLIIAGYADSGGLTRTIRYLQRHVYTHCRDRRDFTYDQLTDAHACTSNSARLCGDKQWLPALLGHLERARKSLLPNKARVRFA